MMVHITSLTPTIYLKFRYQVRICHVSILTLFLLFICYDSELFRECFVFVYLFVVVVFYLFVLGFMGSFSLSFMGGRGGSLFPFLFFFVGCLALFVLSFGLCFFYMVLLKFILFFYFLNIVLLLFFVVVNVVFLIISKYILCLK
jgi:hypothetical protein